MQHSPRSRLGPGIALGVLSSGVAATATLATISVLVSRIIVTPPRHRDDDIRIRSVDAEAGRIVLTATPETTVPGRYGLWFTRSTGYARLGEILAQDAATVTRRIDAVVLGDIRGARSGRWSGWYYLTPEDLGVPFEDAEVMTAVGPAPAWVIPAEGDGTRWAVLVHGRGVTRSETLRAVETLRADGRSLLLVSYRNDGEGPESSDGRYALGEREWGDVDAALGMLRRRGARDVVLMGWSMGGGIALQTLTRSRHRDLVSGVVLDSPAIDWRSIVDHQIVTLRRLPALVSRSVRTVIAHPLFSRAAGLAAPLDWARLDFLRRATELDRPILVLHSDADDFVPATASRALAAARPDIVTYEAFDTAKHTRLWNYDAERWTGAISAWLTRLPRRHG